MKNKLIKDCLEFFCIIVMITIIFDLFNRKSFDLIYFINLFGKSILSTLFFGLLLIVFKKTYRKFSRKP